MDDEADASSTSPVSQGETAPCVLRNREMFRYLLSTFQAMLPPDKAAQFARVAQELDPAIEENCAACRQGALAETRPQPRDPRRSRFLLRLVVSRVSQLFTGKTPQMPRSLIEGIDRYLIKAFGQVIYDELNVEADQILYNLNIDDDVEMWKGIRKNPQWRRFVDMVFIRILLRFEKYSSAKKTFINILDITMQESSRFNFGEDQFAAVFEALFKDTWKDLQDEEQRIRWDFLFGDGAARRLDTILAKGLAQWLERKDRKVLASGRVVHVKAVPHERDTK